VHDHHSHESGRFGDFWILEDLSGSCESGFECESGHNIRNKTSNENRSSDLKSVHCMKHEEIISTRRPFSMFHKICFVISCEISQIS
jgi:hypothetical protein